MKNLNNLIIVEDFYNKIEINMMENKGDIYVPYQI